MSITAKTIRAVGITARSIIAKTVQVYSDFIQYCRYVSNFNGTSSYAESLTRIIDLDTVDPSFKFTWWGDLDGSGTNFSQNISSTPANKEFHIYTNTEFVIFLGGAASSLLDASTVTANAGYGLLEVEYNHSLAEIYTRKDGVLLSTATSVSIGAAREPTAKFKYMARSNNGIDSQGFLKAGQLKNVLIEHNGVTVDLPMTEYKKDLDDEILYINDASNADEFYVDFAGVAGSVSLNTLMLVNDFEIEVSFTEKTLNYGGLITGSNFEFLTRLNASGNLCSCFLQGRTATPTDNIVSRTGANKIILKRVGLVTTIYSEAFDFTVNISSSFSSDTVYIDAIGANNSVGGLRDYFEGEGLSAKIWNNGDRVAGTLVLDMPMNEYKSNFVSNLANPLGTSVWDDNSAALTGDTTELNGQYSMTTATSSVYLDVPSSTGLGYLLTIDLVSGDIQELEGGLSGVQNTGWQNARDAQQQPIPNRYVCLVNNTTNDNLTITKTGSNPVVFNSVSYQRAIDYGVLNGTRGTDYKWASDSHHAIGYNITTEEECVTIPANTVFVDGVPLTDEDGEYVTA